MSETVSGTATSADVEGLAWPKPSSTRVIAITNQKGGVGKTTTAVNVGAWLALHGAKVLIVDMDPQANATTGVGLEPGGDRTVYGVLVGGVPLADAIASTEVEGLFCLPSGIDLAGAEVELVAVFAREGKLKRVLEGAVGDFDYVFVDCPPALGLLTINALTAAREVIVPIQCEYYALEGLGQLVRNIELVRSSLNPGLELTGIVLTMFDARTRLSEQVAQDVRRHFEEKVFKHVIPRSVRVSEAPSFGKPVAVYDPASKGATAYRAVAQEIAGADGSGPTEVN